MSTLGKESIKDKTADLMHDVGQKVVDTFSSDPNKKSTEQNFTVRPITVTVIL